MFALNKDGHDNDASDRLAEGSIQCDIPKTDIYRCDVVQEVEDDLEDDLPELASSSGDDTDDEEEYPRWWNRPHGHQNPTMVRIDVET